MAKEDLRVVRTKRLLAKALKELLQEKPFDKITVNDVCDRALVHRATFYNHFTDKTDLLNFIFDEMQEEIYQNAFDIKDYSSIKELYLGIVVRILDYCLKNKQSLKLILKNSTQEFQAIMLDTIKRGMYYLISKNKDIPQGDANVEAVEAFFTGGVSALCIELVLSEKVIDRQRLTKYLDSVLEVTLGICD